MPLTRRPSTAVAALLVGALALAGCGGNDAASPSGSTVPATTAAGAPDAAGVVRTYASLVERSYAASVASAGKLNTTIAAFVAGPTDATLDAARKQWLAARDDYGPTEAFRFYDGPIDDPDNGPEGRINAWPLDEAYIDYVTGADPKGIVNDAAAFPEITTEVVTEANEKDGETNISTGWHAIEFLLWGQDGNESGPGNRPVTDFTTSPEAPRRITYLRLLGDLLVDDLEGVAEQWAPGKADNYRAKFEAEPDVSLGKVVRGIGALTAGELAGERMNVAFETKDQEDEHSCFSDNTNADVANNAKGVQRVYKAQFPGVSGPSLSDLVKARDAELDKKLTAKLDETVKKATSFPTTFDRMITAEDGTPERTAFKDAITSLEEQGELIASAAKVLGVDVNFEV
jgi:putative iron-regulated protein